MQTLRHDGGKLKSQPYLIIQLLACLLRVATVHNLKTQKISTQRSYQLALL